MVFTGKTVQIQDEYPLDISLDLGEGKVEKYRFKRPKIVVGNLVLGERYIEPYGEATIVNVETNEECVIDFLPRNKAKGEDKLTAEVKDVSGKVAYRLKGNYNDSVRLIDEKGKETTIYEAPENFLPPNHKEIWGMNYFAM